MSKRVLVAIADGSEDIESVTIIDVLRRAEVDVVVASVGDLQVTCARGVRIVADRLIGDCLNDVYDMVIAPGGIPGAENLRDSAELKELLLNQRREKRYYAAICAAPAVVFQPHGLLEDKEATCYPSFMEKLNQKTVSQSPVVVDGHCITSQGPGTAMVFSLKLVEVLCGFDKAQEIAAALLVSYE